MDDTTGYRAKASSRLSGATIQGRMEGLCGKEGGSTGSQAPEGVCRTPGNAQGSDALAKQIGGDHYKSLAIQPIEYIHANGLDYLAGNVVKYVTRHKSKSGAADVRKAIHYLQLILKLQYGVDE